MCENEKNYIDFEICEITFTGKNRFHLGFILYSALTMSMVCFFSVYTIGHNEEKKEKFPVLRIVTEHEAHYENLSPLWFLLSLHICLIIMKEVI